MEGDVQWMTAGKGVQHSEMFPLVQQDQDNTLEIFQVWLNLPAKSKFVDPHFKMLWKEDIPRVEEKDENGHITTIDVIAGDYKGVGPLSPTPNSWAANPANQVAVWTTKIEANGIWKIPAGSSETSRTLYYYEGDNIQMDENILRSDHLIELKPDKDIIVQNGNQDSYFLLLQGKPIQEPVAQYGPFVMNTQQEIIQAFEDFQKTQFGGWPWPETEQTHPREKGRFALHAGGNEEIPGK